MDKYKVKLKKIIKLNKILTDKVPFATKPMIYTSLDDTKRNRKRIMNLGATIEDINNMLTDDGMLDVRHWAFNKLGADKFKRNIGFTIISPETNKKFKKTTIKSNKGKVA